MNWRAESELREIPSKDGIHKNFEVVAVHCFIDEREVATTDIQRLIDAEAG